MNRFQSSANCCVPNFYHIGAVLTPGIVAANLTYAGVHQVEQEVMQQCHYAFSDAATCNFHMFHWHAEK